MSYEVLFNEKMQNYINQLASDLAKNKIGLFKRLKAQYGEDKPRIEQQMTFAISDEPSVKKLLAEARKRGVMEQLKETIVEKTIDKINTM